VTTIGIGDALMARGYDARSMPRSPVGGAPRPLLYAAVWVAMMAVHQDFWLWRDATLLFGALPVGLAYHLGYSLLAAAVMAWLVRIAWPRHLEHLERRPASGGGDADAR
jgi:hypothetical protein